MGVAGLMAATGDMNSNKKPRALSGRTSQAQTFQGLIPLVITNALTLSPRPTATDHTGPMQKFWKAAFVPKCGETKT